MLCSDRRFCRFESCHNHMRPSFDEIYMQLAHSLARRSTCKRLQVGAVIASADYRQILAVGYNGTAAGLDHDCRSHQPGNCGCLHAEDNAVVNCSALRDTTKIVYVTHLPCEMCAKRLVNLGGVSYLYYSSPFRDDSGLEILTRSRIRVRMLPDASELETQDL